MKNFKRSFLVSLFFLSVLHSSAQEHFLFVGTYTQKGSKGIYVYRFNSESGEAALLANTDSVVNPSYLAIAPGGKFIYAVNETGGDKPGMVSAFSFDRKTAKLSLINQQPSGGDHPCYISVHQNGRWVVVGNYTGGNVAALPVRSDGSLQPIAQVVQHAGSSLNKERQEKAHVHATVFSPNQKFLFVPDLGMDKIMQYRFNASAQKPITASTPAFTQVKPGNGPRHFVFHPEIPVAYLMEELSGTVAAYVHNEDKLLLLQRLSSHKPDYTGTRGSADIHVSPDGRFLYASNRGSANTIAVFSIAVDGKLKWQGDHSTLGNTPRNFIIDPTGNYLLVANQESNNIVIFKRDRQTGTLVPTGQQIEVPNPVCLKMMK